MSYQERLSAEINAVLDALAAENKPWSVTWIVHAICSKHDDALAGREHADFFRYCGYEYCRKEVQRHINQRAAEHPEQADLQLRIIGQEHLRSSCAGMPNDDERGTAAVGLPAEDTEANAALYRAMGERYYAHADELEQFLRLRHSAASPSSEG